MVPLPLGATTRRRFLTWLGGIAATFIEMPPLPKTVKAEGAVVTDNMEVTTPPIVTPNGKLE